MQDLMKELKQIIALLIILVGLVTFGVIFIMIIPILSYVLFISSTVLTIVGAARTILWLRSHHLENELHYAQVQFRHTVRAAIELAAKNNANIRISADGSVEIRNFTTRLPKPIVSEEDVPMIEEPAVPAQVPTLLQQLQSGETRIREEQSILGYDRTGARRGPWNQLHSFIVFGSSGSGKSSTVAYYAALAALHGTRFLIIDPDAENSESISQRLAPLAGLFLDPVASDPKSAKRVIELAQSELQVPGDYPLVLIVDELSTIMDSRYWSDIAGDLASILEEYARRGRKWQRTAIAIGQIAKATRTGGTEVRAAFAASFVHRIPAQQARMILSSEEAKMCARLDNGEAMILLSQATEPYRMRIPYASLSDIQAVANLVASVAAPAERDTSPTLETVEKETGKVPAISTETARQANLKRVSQLHALGKSQTDIIYEIWGAKPGSSDAYTKARQEFLDILAVLNVQAVGMEVK